MNDIFEHDGKQWVRISHEEHQQRLLDMLIALDRFCRENKIRYYISGGTLLGAVRQKGFIPWDDDIDVNLPRPDYDKLIQVSHGKIDRYTIGLPDREYMAYVRMNDPDTLVQNRFDGIVVNRECDFSNIFIDLTPMDGLPHSTLGFKFHASLIGFLVGLRGALFHGFFGKSFAKKIIRLLTYPIALALGKQRLFSMIDRLARKYSFDQSEEVGAVVAFLRMIDRVPREKYIQQVELEFEGNHFFATAMYDKHLRMIYGDNYIVPPPENERYSLHSTNVWKKWTEQQE